MRSKQPHSMDELDSNPSTREDSNDIATRLGTGIGPTGIGPLAVAV